MNNDPLPAGNDPVKISPCHSKKIPLWLVLLDNLPTLALFILGAMIIGELSSLAAILYFIYALFSVVWFWARICPWCHHYGTQACPCGYGVISQRFFKRRTDRSFKTVFRRNLPVVYPNWFVPVAVAVYLLATRYSLYLLILTFAFCLIGFALIPLISRFVGCKNCEIRDDCPWMSGKKK